MGSLTISASQLAQVTSMLKQPRTYTVGQIWTQLANFGDSYAAGAAQVFGNPGSMPWLIVRSDWNAAGADTSKFDLVAQQHLVNYINKIGHKISCVPEGFPKTRIVAHRLPEQYRCVSTHFPNRA